MPFTFPSRCGIYAVMTDLIDQFERECAAAAVAPHVALKAGGVEPSLWWKWKSAKVSPTLRSLSKARDGLKMLSKAA